MVSTIKGPIPPHPYYDTSDRNTSFSQPVPRVRPEAQDNYNKGRGVMKYTLEIEGHKAPSTYVRHDSQSKNYMKENLKRLRNIQHQKKEQDEQAVQPVKALWKSAKFENVASKIKEDIEKEPGAPRPHSASFLRAHSRTGFIPMSARPVYTPPPEDKLTVPRAQSARDVKLFRHDIDFIHLNGSSVKHTAVKRAPSVTALDDIKKRQDEELATYRKGQVPGYLRKRQEEWKKEEEVRIANIPDPDLPAGHRLLPQKERLETLEKLNKAHSDLIQELSALPIRTDTVRLRRKKEELDQKITQVDEAIRIFSRPKVFVKLDA